MNRLSFNAIISSIIVFLIAATPSLHAQSGSIIGRVTDKESGKPLAGATVRVFGESARGNGAIANADGRYAVRALPPGRYGVRISFLSYAPFEDSVTVSADQATTVNAALAQSQLQLSDIVVSASRRPEKITTAPASVTVIEARRVQELPALSPV